MKPITLFPARPVTRTRGLGSRGVTLVELVTVISILGILVNVSFPLASSFIKRAQAAKVIGDYEVIRNAVVSYYADTHTYPASAGWDTVPAGLAPVLPSGFQFKNGNATYRWRRWSLPDGTPADQNPVELMALQVKSSDTALIAAIQDHYQGRVTQVREDQVTFVVF